MIRALLTAMLLAFAGASGAQDATGLGELPQGKSAMSGAGRAKSISLPAAYAFGARSVQAPLLSSADPGPEASHHQDPVHGGARGSCENSGAALCYDASDNHIIYRPARQFMPTVNGLTAENVSVRRHGIHFKYSFP
ncbi:MAG TPA: hypothetical protein VKR38_00805 [Usitatibacter sp.]|nr:hypothetical protein [Usitatibacter sp.]